MVYIIDSGFTASQTPIFGKHQRLRKDESLSDQQSFQYEDKGWDQDILLVLQHTVC